MWQNLIEYRNKREIEYEKNIYTFNNVFDLRERGRGNAMVATAHDLQIRPHQMLCINGRGLRQ